MTSPNELNAFSKTLAELVTSASQHVVSVDGARRLNSSGIVWRPGLVVTADHALERHEEIRVRLPDNRTVAASLVGRDPGTDLAVLRFEDPENRVLASRTAGTASLHLGSIVLAIGRRGENGPCASLGIVGAISGPWRTWKGGHVEQFIRPDVSMYPALSGGALVDGGGMVIGMNTGGLTRHVGTTIPAVTVDRVVDELLARGRVRRGYLGIGMHPVQLPDGTIGLIVLSVEAGGPAAKAGILIGDVILALNGLAVTDTDDVQKFLNPELVDKEIVVSVWRAGTQVGVKLVVGERVVERGREGGRRCR